MIDMGRNTTSNYPSLVPAPSQVNAPSIKVFMNTLRLGDRIHLLMEFLFRMYSIFLGY